MNPAFSGTLTRNEHLWADTEQWFSYLDKEFELTLDACQSGSSLDRPRLFTSGENPLAESWRNERVFVFPPLDADPSPWLEKSWHESQTGNALAVCLISLATCHDWWVLWASRATEIRLPRGRLKTDSSDDAPAWPIAILIFRPKNNQIVTFLDVLDLAL